MVKKIVVFLCLIGFFAIQSMEVETKQEPSNNQEDGNAQVKEENLKRTRFIAQYIFSRSKVNNPLYDHRYPQTRTKKTKEII